LKISQFGVIYKNAGFSPGGAYRVTTGENLIKLYSCWRMKNFCCNRAYKSSDEFEIAFQLSQEYAETVGFCLCFQDFGKELKFLACKNTAPQFCILLAR